MRSSERRYAQEQASLGLIDFFSIKFLAIYKYIVLKKKLFNFFQELLYSTEFWSIISLFLCHILFVCVFINIVIVSSSFICYQIFFVNKKHNRPNRFRIHCNIIPIIVTLSKSSIECCAERWHSTGANCKCWRWYKVRWCTSTVVHEWRSKIDTLSTA